MTYNYVVRLYSYLKSTEGCGVRAAERLQLYFGNITFKRNECTKQVFCLVHIAKIQCEIKS